MIQQSITMVACNKMLKTVPCLSLKNDENFIISRYLNSAARSFEAFSSVSPSSAGMISPLQTSTSNHCNRLRLHLYLLFVICLCSFLFSFRMETNIPFNSLEIVKMVVVSNAHRCFTYTRSHSLTSTHPAMNRQTSIAHH